MQKPMWLAVLVAVVLAIPLSAAFGQAAPPPAAPPATAPAPAPAPAPVAIPANAKLVDLWGNFLHFIKLADVNVAVAYGNAIIASKPDPKEVYQLAAQTDPENETLSRGRNVKGLSGVIDQITGIIDEGARQLRMDPKEIERNIQALGGAPRQYMLAKERLLASGEFAVPQLINALALEKTDQAVRDRIAQLLPDLGSTDKNVVRPLAESLKSESVTVKEAVARALGKIGYPQAAPYLKEVTLDKALPEPVRAAATAALVAVAGKAALDKPAAELYFQLGCKYYYKAESFMPDSRYDTANVWYWQKDLGLVGKAVPTAIFPYVYAMRAAKRTLELDPAFAPAVPMWLAADIHRQADLPAGAKDTTQPAEALDAKSMAMASGAVNLQAMLAQALKDSDVTVALAAIDGLSRTARGGNLVAPVAGGANPLVDALGNPNRQIRFLAALTLANAQPCNKFNGSNIVVPVLTEALRQSGTKVAALVDPNPDHRNKIKDSLRAAGIEVFDADTTGKAFIDAKAAGGADLLVLSSSLKNPNVTGIIATVRSDPAAARTPVLVVAAAADIATMRDLAKADTLVTVLDEEKADAAGVKEASSAALGKAVGTTSMPAEASAEWAVKAAEAIRGLAMTNNATFNLCDALPALVAATKDKRDPVRIAVAGALAFIKSADVQKALFTVADDAQAAEEVRLAAYNALSENIQRFDSDLNEAQVQAVVKTVGAKDTPAKLREAASRLLGLVAPPSKQINSLIVGQ